MNPARTFVTGLIGGVRVETIEEPTMRDIRILDKLIDELAKGKGMDKILRRWGQPFSPSLTISAMATAGFIGSTLMYLDTTETTWTDEADARQRNGDQTNHEHCMDARFGNGPSLLGSA